MAKNNSWMKGFLTGLFGPRVYLFLAGFFGVGLDAPLENASAQGAKMAEIALTEIQQTIAAVTLDIGKFQATKKQQEQRLQQLTQQRDSAERSLDRAVSAMDAASQNPNANPDEIAELEANLTTIADNVGILDEQVTQQTGIVEKLTQGLDSAKKRLRSEERKLSQLKNRLDMAKTEAETAQALAELNNLNFGNDATDAVDKFIKGAGKKYESAAATGELIDGSLDSVLSAAERTDKAQQAIDRVRSRRAGALPPATGVDMSQLQPERHRENA